MNNNAVINSKSPVLSKQRYERISNITGYNVVKSGILESFATLDNFLSTKTIRNYEFNLDREDFVVFKNQSIKSVANGSNQSLIGQTQSKDAYNIVSGSLEGEHYAGVFHSRKDIIDYAEMQVLEKELGKQAESQLWSEFDSHLMGTINNNVGDGMKLNKGILDIITDVDNSLFSSNPIGSADYAKVYNYLCEKQIQLNASNKLPNFNPVVVIVSGAKMQSLFLKSNITTNSLINSLEIMLIGMNIFPVYLSNLVDSRDYAIMLSSQSLHLYIGNLPERKSNPPVYDLWRKKVEIYYVMNNPFVIPIALGDIGYIINGGSTGINGGRSAV